MIRRLIISKKEKTDILTRYGINEYITEEFERNDNGQVVVGNNKYDLFVDGVKRYYGGQEDGKYKICNDADISGWTTFCKSIDIKPETVKHFDSEMSKGVSPISYTTPEGKNIEFKKI